MEKFKELKESELVGTSGGDLGPIDRLFESWSIRAMIAIGDAADFVSGLGDGFISGFRGNQNNW